MIFIAYDCNGHVRSIVNAKTLDVARAYWQGKNLTPYSEKSLDDFGIPGENGVSVVPLLETRVENSKDPFDRKKDIIVVQ